MYDLDALLILISQMRETIQKKAKKYIQQFVASE